MSNRRIAGNAVLAVLVVLVLIALAFWGGLHFGASGSGKDGEGTGPAPVADLAPSLPQDRFSIVVAEDTLLVDGKAVEMEEIVALAKEDGRPIRIFWKRARTGAESGLKKVLADAGLSYDEDSLD